ncbi:unnamed protein product [Cuscuta epithymum]|uniref:CCR4-NOT transcription complex subunit 10 n=1 Tax=Cuscuta epithymum TaxID=186058 RepID=A0AAV0FKL6_9ASTE|nr:unnamed protein product [Cuscuta epithymum]
MDSSLPSASMAVSGNREAAVSSAAALATAEDEVSPPTISGLTREASLLFHTGQYKDCIRVLNQLLQKKEGDPKVLHNIVIAENSQDGCTDPKRLIEELENFKNRKEQLVGVSEDRAEAATGNSGCKHAGGIKGNNSSIDTLNQDTNLRSSQAVFTDELDISVMLYNLAVCWFHLHEYTKAFSILDELFRNIQPVDEDTAKRICLLLLDVALVSNNAKRAMDVIGYLEKVFCSSSLINQATRGNSTPQHGSNLQSKPVSGSSNSTIPNAKHHPDPLVAPNNSESSLTRSLSEEVLEDDTLHLISSIEMGGQNPPPRQPSKDLPKSQTEESISTTMDMNDKLMLFNVRFNLLTRNLKTAMTCAKNGMVKENSLALYLKSQVEYALGKYPRAIRQLDDSRKRREEAGITCMYYNNLGCIHYRLGKHHTSGALFNMALKSCSSLWKEKPKKLSSISQDKTAFISYNIGMHFLTCGKPVLAAWYFYKSRSVFYKKPLLWLRLAECCLVALEQGLLKSSSTSCSEKSGIEVHVVGKGKWRHLVIGNDNSIGGEELEVGGGQPNLSMTFARECLSMALYFLRCSELPKNEENEPRETKKISSVVNSEPKEKKGSGGGQNASQVQSSSMSEYENICREENQMIEQALLADLSYVELELENSLKALSTAKNLLKQSVSSKIYTFLGNVYAAEALCLLSRPKEAAEHLYVYLSGDNGVQHPFDQDDVEAWRVEKSVDSKDPSTSGSVTEFKSSVFLNPEEARGVLFANLATMSAMQRDLERAREYVMAALAIMPHNSKVNLIAIYVDLLGGKTEEALNKLRQCRSVRFVQEGLPGNSSSL